MMELNREQIVKALEFCTGIKKLDACANCPAHLGCNDCVDFLREESLALIKELTEENERLRLISTHICVEDVISPEEMEELRMAHTWSGQHGDPVGEPGECGLKCNCVADTVKKMQERLNDRIDKTMNVFDFQISEFDAVRQVLRWVKNDIYQVAKEMLEEV